jgi:hypothetical protein
MEDTKKESYIKELNLKTIRRNRSSNIKRKLGFRNQLLQLFLSKATIVLVACDKNSHIGQVEKTYFSSSASL